MTSRDGTTIGYRQIGRGPGLILLHGAMQAAQSFMRLATALSNSFTVYVPDRRGRGMSGPFGYQHGMEKELQDLQALVVGTGAQDVFGLSSGALIALQATLFLPTLRKVALYEPPLAVAGVTSPMAWAPRYERELALGDLAAAMVSCMEGTGDIATIKVPRFILVLLMRLAIRTSASDGKIGNVPLDVLIRSVHFDIRLAAEIADTVETFKAAHTEILLLGGDRSAAYLAPALDALAGVLPNAKRIELPGLGHLAADDVGQPERVADILRPFFSQR
ncbi:alpha/beta fold hydrolase [Mesorhizobium sp. 113-3-3]|uniref:alpha/beta fold hydrolase n=1 Tax=Mesorhizobium sp. 113-3-3 TaxID=2744516 RepID=UPI00192911D1|nr:alpha/beta hydrolase [Mesorhizobium sp. 113-3-3]